MHFTSGKMFVRDSMCYENHRRFYRCRQSKRRTLKHSASFFNNCIYIKVDKSSEATKIEYFIDIEKTLNMEIIDSYLSIIVQISLINFYFEKFSKVFKIYIYFLAVTFLVLFGILKIIFQLNALRVFGFSFVQ